MLVEILFFGRGGQGGVTAATILAAAAVKDGLYAQAFPFFGAERRGAPVRAFARISDRPVLRHGMFDDADVLVVLHPGLVTTGLAKGFGVRDGGLLVLNAPSRELARPEYFKLHGRARAYVVDATKIALRNNLVVAGWPVVNTAVLGALVRALEGRVRIRVESVEEAVRGYFGGKVGEANAKAVREAYEETVEVGEVGG